MDSAKAARLKTLYEQLTGTDYELRRFCTPQPPDNPQPLTQEELLHSEALRQQREQIIAEVERLERERE